MCTQDRLVLAREVLHMIQINGLTLTHKKDLRIILKDFSLVLNDGDKAVIIGEEGNGKSSLMKWMVDPDLIEDYIDAEGQRMLGREKIAYLPQELPEEHKGKTVYEYFSENEYFWDYSPKDLCSMAKDFDVETEFFYREQKMTSLSGGEKIKAQLMNILMQNPTALFMDEPSNDIDISTLELLEKIINGWKGIVLFISHDETLIERTANMIIHIEQLQRKMKPKYSVARLPYRKYVETRLQLFDRQEQQANNDRREKKIRDEKYRKIMQSVEHSLRSCSRQDPFKAKCIKSKMHTVKAMEKRFAKEDDNMTEMPEQEEAIFFKLGNKEDSIPSGKVVLEYELDELQASNENEECNKTLARNIFLRVQGSEKICIIGKNGIGKTTLIRKIAKSMLERKDLRVEYMPQNYEELLNLDMTPVDFLDSTGDKEERTRIRTYLGSLKYTVDEMEHPIRELSGGQKAKILLLKMSMSGANVLILDEPTRNFSPLSSPVIRGMLREFPGAIISVSHDRKYIDEVCDKVYELTADGMRILAE